jgi:hypothetical protein
MAPKGVSRCRLPQGLRRCTCASWAVKPKKELPGALERRVSQPVPGARVPRWAAVSSPRAATHHPARAGSGGALQDGGARPAGWPTPQPAAQAARRPRGQRQPAGGQGVWGGKQAGTRVLHSTRAPACAAGKPVSRALAPINLVSWFFRLGSDSRPPRQATPWVVFSGTNGRCMAIRVAGLPAASQLLSLQWPSRRKMRLAAAVPEVCVRQGELADSDLPLLHTPDTQRGSTHYRCENPLRVWRPQAEKAGQFPCGGSTASCAVGAALADRRGQCRPAA